MGESKNEKKEKEKRATAEAYPSNFGYLCDLFDNLRNFCSLLSDACTLNDIYHRGTSK